MLRTYKLKHEINKNKQDKIFKIFSQYRKTAKQIANNQWKIFNQTKKFNKNTKINVESKLSARYKQTCQYQVVGTLESFVSNKQNDFNDIVNKSNLNDETKTQLYILNKEKKWYKDEIAKTIWRHILKKNNKPSFKNCNLALDQKEAIITENNGNSFFGYWIKLSTLESRKPIYLPIKTNNYYENIQGERKNFIQINKDEKNNLTICFIKEIEKKEYTPITPKISLDRGLKFPFITNNGDFLGRKFYNKLKKIDNKIQKLTSNRQRQGLKVSCSKYKRLINKLRHFIKNEINRIINKLIFLYKPKEIALEKLDFRNQNMSRRTNRLITFIGNKMAKEKFNNINEEYGIIITYVNPAYTSQTCSNCGYVDKKNRKTQESFCCLKCGKKLNADVNGARNVFIRSSDEEITVYKSRKLVLQILIKRYLERNMSYYSIANDLLLHSKNVA